MLREIRIGMPAGLIALCLLASVAWAQPGGRHCNHAIYGVITDSETLEPLVFAKVFLPSTGKGALTGQNGEYRIVGLCDGPDTLVVSHIGCGVQHFAVTIEENTHFDIQLPHSQSHTDTVHIHDKHPDPKPTQAESMMSGKQLDKVAGKSLGEALKEMAGVNALQTGPSIFKPMIHGMHSNRIVIMNNGVRQESQQWGSEHAPEIDPFTATTLRVVKGANGVRYGPDAIAGVVLVEPGPMPDSAGIQGAVHIVGSSNGWGGSAAGMLEGRLKSLHPLAWRVQGSLKRSGNVHTPDYILANTGIREANASLTLSWTKDRYGLELFGSRFSTDVGIFQGSHIGNLTDLQAAMASDTPLVHGDFTYAIGRPYQHVVHYLGKLRGWFETGHIGKLVGTFAYQHNMRQEFDNHRSSAQMEGAPQLDYRISTISGDVAWEHEKIAGWKGAVGLSTQMQINRYLGFFFIPNFFNYNIGPYWVERLVKLRWELEAGIRFDRRFNQIWMWQGNEVVSPIKTWQNLSASLGGLVRVNEHLGIHANIGTAWRPPTMNELYSRGLHHGAASFEIGDSNLRAEQALTSSLSLQYRGHGKFGGDLGVYWNYIHDFIYQEPVQPATLTIRGAFPTFMSKQVDARFAGVDAAFHWNLIEQLQWTGKASMVRAQNLTLDEPLIFIPPDRFETGLGYTLTGGKYFHSPQVNLSVVYTRRQNRFPAGVDYTDPPAAWYLLNAELSTTIAIGKWLPDIMVGCYNLTNTRYRDYMNRFRYYSDEMGRNFSFRLKFPIH